jgi:selenocysteine lyase/cysteine desulfurase
MVRHPRGTFLHHNFVCAVLNDVFGVQARGGCACAGRYAHDLMGIDEKLAKEYEALLLRRYVCVGHTRRLILVRSPRSIAAEISTCPRARLTFSRVEQQRGLTLDPSATPNNLQTTSKQFLLTHFYTAHAHSHAHAHAHSMLVLLRIAHRSAGLFLKAVYFVILADCLSGVAILIFFSASISVEYYP